MYTIHLWNGKYGNGAKFVVEDENGKFAEFSPTRPKDVVWVDTDITEDKDYGDWEDFEEEQVDDIKDIIM